MKMLLLSLVLAAVGGLMGCSTSPAFDQSFGQATTVMVVQQYRDPDAEQKNAGRLVDGIEANAASAAMDRYYKSFAEPPTSNNVLNIDFGRASTGR